MKADVDQKSAGVLAGSKTELADRAGAASGGVGASIMRSRLFFKYTLLFVSVVVLALFANGGFEVWFSYQEHKGSLISIQQQQATRSKSSSPKSRAKWAGRRSYRGPTARSISAVSTRCAFCVRCRLSPNLRRSMRRAANNLKSSG